MKNKIILTLLISVGVTCVFVSLITQHIQIIVLTKTIGVIILLVSIKKLKTSTSINIHEKQS